MTVGCLRFALVGAALLGLAACQPSEPVVESPAEPPLTRATNPPPLEPAVDAPPLPDFRTIADTDTKKAAFFAYLSPLVEQQNRRVERLRQHLKRLEQLLDTQGALHPDDRTWLATLAQRYRVDAEAPAAQIAGLRTKLGPLPPALVLAQAANESAWGTSRFAREGNNLFGQWCFTPGCGLAPLRRNAGASHEVAAYDSVAEGVHRYFVNLNGHDSYAELRAIRRCLDEAQLPLQGRALAAGLDSYSARGNHYVKELRAMIRINELEPWPRDWWGSRDPAHPCYPLVQVTVKKPDPLKPSTAASQASASPTSAVSAATSTGISKARLSPTTSAATASPASAATPSLARPKEPAPEAG